MDHYQQRWVRLFARDGAEDWAMTMGQHTFYSVPEKEVTTTWRRHEECHKRQFKRDGWVKFLLRYAWEGLTKGYHHVSYEVEAREAAQRGY